LIKRCSEAESAYLDKVTNGETDSEVDLIDHCFVYMGGSIKSLNKLLKELIGLTKRLEGHYKRLELSEQVSQQHREPRDDESQAYTSS